MYTQMNQNVMTYLANQYQQEYLQQAAADRQARIMREAGQRQTAAVGHAPRRPGFYRLSRLLHRPPTGVAA